jgi:flagellar hook-length control protein FliK
MRFSVPRVASEPSAVPPSRPQPSPRSRADADGHNPATPFAALLDSTDPSAGRASTKRSTLSAHAERADRSHTARSQGKSSEHAHSRRDHEGRGTSETDNATKSDSAKAAPANDDPKTDPQAAAEAAAAPDTPPTTDTPAADESLTPATAEQAQIAVVVAAATAEASADDDSSETKESTDKDSKDAKASKTTDTASKLEPTATALPPADASIDAEPAPSSDTDRVAIHGANRSGGPHHPAHPENVDITSPDAAHGDPKDAAPTDPHASAADHAENGRTSAAAKTETTPDNVRLAGDLVKKPQAETSSPHDATGALKTGADAMQNLGAGAQTQQTTTTSASGATGPSPAPTAATAVPLAGLAVEIAMQARGGKHHFNIRLDPPELGRIDVRLDVDRDGNVSSRLIVERSDTLDLLKRDASQLERALQQAGLKTSDNALEFSLRQQTSGQDNTPKQTPVTQLVVPGDDPLPPETMRRGYGQLYGLGRGLDIRV